MFSATFTRKEFGTRPHHPSQYHGHRRRAQAIERRPSPVTGESDGSAAIADQSPVAHCKIYTARPRVPRDSCQPAKGVSPAGDVWSLRHDAGRNPLRGICPRATRRSGETISRCRPTCPSPSWISCVTRSLVPKPEGRWTVTQIAARLEDRAPVPPQVRTSPRPAQPASRPQVPRPPSGPVTLTVTLFPSRSACFWPQFCSRQNYSGAIPRSPRSPRLPPLHSKSRPRKQYRNRKDP